MAFEKTGKIRLVRKIPLLGYLCQGLVRIAQQHFHLGDKLLFYQLLRRPSLKAPGSRPVEIPGRNAKLFRIKRRSMLDSPVFPYQLQELLAQQLLARIFRVDFQLLGNSIEQP